MTSTPQAAVLAAIPHRSPFLFIDEIVSQNDERIVCRKQFTADEGFFAGHFPHFPLVPGVVLCEAAMQAGAILLAGKTAEAEQAAVASRRVPVATRLNNVRFKQMVRPEDTVEIEVTLDDSVGGAFFLTGKVSCEGRVAVRLEFACTLAEPPADR